MEKQIEDKNTEMGNVITRSEEFIQKNQKTLIIAVIAILVVVLAIFGLRRWYFQPRETRAAEEMFAAEQWFAQGDFQKALDGDDTYRGFGNMICGTFLDGRNDVLPCLFIRLFLGPLLHIFDELGLFQLYFVLYNT